MRDIPVYGKITVQHKPDILPLGSGRDKGSQAVWSICRACFESVSNPVSVTR